MNNPLLKSFVYICWQIRNDFHSNQTHKTNIEVRTSGKNELKLKLELTKGSYEYKVDYFLRRETSRFGCSVTKFQLS